MEHLFQQIEHLSDDDFEALINHVDKLRKRRADDIMAEAKRRASRFAKYTETGAAAGKKTGKRAPKFANPYDPSQTWSGMGRKPQWFQDYINNGGDENQIRVAE